MEFVDRATLHQCVYPVTSDDVGMFINKWEIMLTRLCKMPDDNELHWVFWEQVKYSKRMESDWKDYHKDARDDPKGPRCCYSWLMKTILTQLEYERQTKVDLQVLNNTRSIWTGAGRGKGGAGSYVDNKGSGGGKGKTGVRGNGKGKGGWRQRQSMPAAPAANLPAAYGKQTKAQKKAAKGVADAMAALNTANAHIHTQPAAPAKGDKGKGKGGGKGNKGGGKGKDKFKVSNGATHYPSITKDAAMAGKQCLMFLFGACTFGDSCKWEHNEANRKPKSGAAAPAPAPKGAKKGKGKGKGPKKKVCDSTGVCKYWLSKKGCKFTADQCKEGSHPAGKKGSKPNIALVAIDWDEENDQVYVMEVDAAPAVGLNPQDDCGDWDTNDVDQANYADESWTNNDDPAAVSQEQWDANYDESWDDDNELDEDDYGKEFNECSAWDGWG